MKFFGRSEDGERRTENTPPRDYLKELCGGDDELYLSMSYFLLSNPERQLSQLGSLSELMTKANTDSHQSNMRSRIDFETAAKIAIHGEDVENARKMLTRAHQVSESMFFRRLHEKLLADIEHTVTLARAYYKAKGATTK